PYALYARHILKLEAAPMIGEEPDARDRGSLVHAVSEALVKDGIDPSAPDAPEALRAVIARVFSRLDAFPALAATWSARLSALVPDLLDYEAGRIALGLTRHAEASGAMTIDIAGEPFRLRGRADRIDLHGDGRVDIIDFKTGKPPSRKQVEAGLAPQLPMEMAMVLDGAFEGIVAAAPGDLIHVQIGAGRGGFKEQAQPAGNLHDKVRGELEALIALMRQEGFAFAAQRRPAPRRFAGDYDHLARLSEWGMESDADETG
ncbi:MAG: PD-(D/E)XK nuclease family protein, partial [Hyphomicrobiaceae bacterium]|nr:PD-(D/E)XK nuclease family protein [Hyphomicrobiaceae bacterium]